MTRSLFVNIMSFQNFNADQEVAFESSVNISANMPDLCFQKLHWFGGVFSVVFHVQYLADPQVLQYIRILPYQQTSSL